MPTGETKIVTTEFVNGFPPEQWQFCLLVVQDDYFRSLEYTKLTATEPEAKVHAEIPEKEYHKVGLIPCNRSKEFSNHFFLSFFCKWCFEKIIGIVSCRCLQYYKSDKKQTRDNFTRKWNDVSEAREKTTVFPWGKLQLTALSWTASHILFHQVTLYRAPHLTSYFGVDTRQW